jgi:hypothetical protein
VAHPHPLDDARKLLRGAEVLSLAWFDGEIVTMRRDHRSSGFGPKGD